MKKALISPLFNKELVQIAISKRIFILRTIYLAIAILLILLINLITHVNDVPHEYIGKALFITLTSFQLIGISLVMPIITASTVAGEREANTLSLLFLTRLSPLNIIQDKGLTRILLMLYLVALSAPLYFAIFLLGGVDIHETVMVICFFFSYIFITGAISLFSSSIRHSVFVSIMTSYVYIFLWACISGLIIAVSKSPVFGVIINPLFSIMALLNPTDFGTNPLYNDYSEFITAKISWLFSTAHLPLSNSIESKLPMYLTGISNLGISIFFYTLLILIAAKKIGRVSKNSQLQEFDNSEKKERNNLRKQIRLRKVQFTDLQNGFAEGFKNYLTGLPGLIGKNSLVSFILGGVLVIFYGLVLYINMEFGGSGGYMAFYFLLMPFVLIFIIFKATFYFPTEKKYDRFQLLLSTGVKAKDYFPGICYSFLLSCLWMVLITASFLVLECLFHFKTPILGLLITFIVSYVFISIVCLRLSLTAASTAKAVMRSLVFIFIFYIFPPIAIAILQMISFSMNYDHADQDIYQMLYSLTPICQLTIPVEATEPEHLGGFAVNNLGMILATIITVSATRLNFNRLVGRQ